MDYQGLSRIISGGQTGVDQGALAAAMDAGVVTGGRVPRGYRTSQGRMPVLSVFGVEEDDSPDYGPRTKHNVLNSDATLIIATNLESPGTKLTIDLCRHHDKPLHIIQVSEKGLNDTSYTWSWDVVDEAYAFLAHKQTRTLNVAGHREVAQSTAMFDLSYHLVKRLVLTFDADNLLVRDNDL